MDFYPHTAYVTRETGAVDEVGTPLIIMVRKSGKAGLQKPTSSNISLGLQYGADTLLIIPDADKVFKIDDDVFIVVENNVHITAKVKDMDTNKEPGIAMTRLWLKRTQ